MFVSLTLVKTICSSTRMSCLLPQFKCLPDTFSLNFNKSSHLHHSKCKETIYLRTQCVLSASQMTSTATTTVLDVDKLQLPSLEANTRTLPGERSWKLPISTNATAVLDLEQLRTPSLETHSSSESIDKQWMYTGTVGPPAETRPGRPSTKETLATSEEAVIAVTAAEAVALAKAALEVAKDAALRLNLSKPMNADSNPAATSYLKNSVTERSGLGQLPEVEKLRELRSAEISLGGGTHDSHHSLSESGDIEPTQEDLELLQAEIEKSIAVRSRRQTERKAKRTRAAEKAAANVVSVKSGSTSRKKRSSSQDVDYSDPLRYFRGATSSSRLLTATEEQQLSEGIQGLLELERLQEELTQRGGVPPTHAQWAAAAGIDQKTLRERLNYGILCKDKMIKSNIRLVISIAKKFQGSGMNLQDLVQEGCRGLVRGAEKFDASKGFKFSTYAHWWIKQSVRKSLSDQSRTIRLPFHMVEATYRVKEARKQLFSENGRHPDDEEVAEATGLSMTRLSAVMLTPKAPRSLDQKIGVNQDLKPSEVISDPEAETSEEMLLKQFMRDDLDKILDTLNRREKQVIRWRFGLEDGRMKTLQEIGELMGVSRERIRQIESCAFRKLKNKKRTKHWQQYILS